MIIQIAYKGSINISTDCLCDFVIQISPFYCKSQNQNLVHKGMPIPWISLHRWMFSPLQSVPLYLSAPTVQLLFTCSTLQSVSFLSSAIHCVFTEHSFPSSSLFSTHPFMRCDGATAPTVIHTSWFFSYNTRGFIGQSHCPRKGTTCH